MKNITLLKLQLVMGILLGTAVTGPFLWNFGPTSDDAPVLKIAHILFLAVATFWFFMTHRTPDEERLDYGSM